MGIRRPSGISTGGIPANNQAAQDAIEEVPLLESQNPGVIALLETAKRAAAADTAVLLTGESGTGKDVLARQIHRWSPRRDGPFVVLNCTALAEQLLENEPFGQVRGGFIGAVSDNPGRLDAGNGGTVLFDEIGDLTPSLQAKFLRLVQEQSSEQIASSRTIRVNVRMMAASNRNLEAEVAARRFREDLYYRLNVIALRLPPLRERTLDIVPLAGWMLRQASLKADRAEFRLSPEAAEALVNYRWPGNIRELRNALERAVTLARTETITLNDLPDSIYKDASCMFLASANGTGLKEREHDYILRVLAETPTLEEAAAKLGINVTTLWRKRKRYGIERNRTKRY
jgi:two-component system, NtrC family, response regulator AlgB